MGESMEGKLPGYPTCVSLHRVGEACRMGVCRRYLAIQEWDAGVWRAGNSAEALARGAGPVVAKADGQEVGGSQPQRPVVDRAAPVAQ